MTDVKWDENVVIGNKRFDNTIIIKLKNKNDEWNVGDTSQPLSLPLSPPA